MKIRISVTSLEAVDPMINICSLLLPICLRAVSYNQELSEQA